MVILIEHGAEIISIHAPRTGSDFLCDKIVNSSYHFNPRSPHGERLQAHKTASRWCDFNPRSPHGERRDLLEQYIPAKLISIHAPRTGSDGRKGASRRAGGKFQSTLPARGATTYLQGLS